MNFIETSAALVGDNSFFGFTSPVAGQRYRLQVSPTFGDLTYQTALADYRRYYLLRPVTFAFRGMHYARYGKDAESEQLTPLYIGQEPFIRGYNIESFETSECTQVPGDAQGCPEFDRLVGSRLAIANLELRIPLFGTREFGLINETLGLNLDWLGDPTLAKAAVLLTNLWMGFPYMFLICTGALQSIPDDVKEAAAVDGAGPVRTLVSVTMPLLLVAVGPLLVASFAFNFNNFTLIYLVTRGGPFDSGNSLVGNTDLLINFAYRIALESGTPNIGLASAVSIVIFGLVAVISYIGFRQSNALEEVN